MSKLSRRSQGGASNQSRLSENKLFEIHDLPESKPKKAAKPRQPTKKKIPASKKGSLFPKEVDSRTFFIPEVQPLIKPLENGKHPQTPLVSHTLNKSENTKTKQTKQLPDPNISSSQKTSTGGLPIPRQHYKTTSSSSLPKQTINLRVRPKSASAARRPNPEPGQWNCQTACEDWNMQRLNSDAQRWKSIPKLQSEKETSPHRVARALSQRKPSIPGQVCYGTNNQGVSLPRRPQSAINGRENRPLPVGSDKSNNEFHREEYGGWQGSTLLHEERIGYDRRFRYPQKFAVADVAAVNNHQPQDLAKPAWIHTTSSSNFAKVH